MRKNRLTLVIVFLLSSMIISLTSCKSCGTKNKDLPPGTHCVSVIEVIQTSNYTYLQVEEDDNKFWIAVVSQEAKPGDVIYYSKSMEMKNFTSRELQRTFPSVYFVEDPSDKPVTMANKTPQNFSSRKNEMQRHKDILIEPVNGGISIAELYKNTDKYAGKTVKIRGHVVKYSKEIMKKNWVHIQDGTEYNGKFDLTVTTTDSVMVGNNVTFTGIINLNKDFGYGYVYEVIMEDAKPSDLKVAEEM